MMKRRLQLIGADGISLDRADFWFSQEDQRIQSEFFAMKFWFRFYQGGKSSKNKVNTKNAKEPGGKFAN